MGGPLVDLMRDPGSEKPVRCCLCYDWQALDELATDPADGKRWDVCVPCARHELETCARLGLPTPPYQVPS